MQVIKLETPIIKNSSLIFVSRIAKQIEKDLYNDLLFTIKYRNNVYETKQAIENTICTDNNFMIEQAWVSSDTFLLPTHTHTYNLIFTAYL